MSNRIERVAVPDLGGATEVSVIEILVKPGDEIKKEDSLITLEGDKASMDIPSPLSGKIKEIQVKIGDKIKEGDSILTMEVADEENNQMEQTNQTEVATHIKQVVVPDLGGTAEVSVIEVLVKPGDEVKKEDSLITLEGDKASMDIPSPFAGSIKEIQLKVGDKIKEGYNILTIEVSSQNNSSQKSSKTITEEIESKSSFIKQQKSEEENQSSEHLAEVPTNFGISIHAGPAVRRIAHEFGVDLRKIKGSGQKNRILKQDVQKFVKEQLKIAQGKSENGSLPPLPAIDFSKFGSIEEKPLSKIQKATGVNLSRNWMTVPHVTQFGEADITELEKFRQNQKEEAEKKGVRLTPLVFIIKAVVDALKKFPHFNASLNSTGEGLILKKYFHVGVAVDTPEGLVVPVIRDADKKGLFELAKELADVSAKARKRALSLPDLQGGCFSISSLGGIGGTFFTPIINAPEVAILGISQMQWKTVCDKTGDCKLRLLLPLSLSYDHRVIDGADGARFIVYLSERLSDIKDIKTLLF